MAGEMNLENMLQSLSPELIDGEFVFCSVKNARYGDYPRTSPIATFAEPEGLTLVMTKEAAEHSGLGYQGVFRCISLGVHSSLQATGLTAAVSSRLSERNIPANMIAACFHDHVFVPSGSADEAIDILSNLGR